MVMVRRARLRAVAPGMGTAHLVAAGARVIAVELHPRRARVLGERFPGVTVIQADAATIRLPGRPFRVVANPLRTVGRLAAAAAGPGSRLTAADLVLQRAVVRTQASRAPRRFSLAAGMSLPRRAFVPPPRVDSAVLVVRRR
jgi:23S rRNA (adenine-N6)-dimethyltransferase